MKILVFMLYSYHQCLMMMSLLLGVFTKNICTYVKILIEAMLHKPIFEHKTLEPDMHNP